MTNTQAPTPRESMAFDVVIVGGGVAGLSCAIRIKQNAHETGQNISVCVVDKGREIGGHVLSGAVIDPCALNELFPDWQKMGAPLTTPVTDDLFVLLTKTKAFKLFTPAQLKNRGNWIGSLGALARWLGEQAVALGVDVFSGFPATEILCSPEGQIKGIATGDMGLDEGGQPGPNFVRGVELMATYTIFAEGCRGSLSEQLMQHFKLREDACPQTYGLGIKEVWEVAPEKHKPGRVLHTVGWPLSSDTYGGSFLYHMDNNLVVVGLVAGLDYKNPYLSPFEEMQRFKTHPKISPLFDGAKRVAYGARALNEGGFQSIPKLVFPGGALVGAAAGFMNVPRLKGSHTAMKSALVCADAICDGLTQETPPAEIPNYTESLETSWVWTELYKVRNIRPVFRLGLWLGLAYAAFDTYILRGHAPWTFKYSPDHAHIHRASQDHKIDYAKPDNVLTFDRLSSVYLANVSAGENQPCHIKLKDLTVPLNTNLVLFDGPETRYCPAQVFEFLNEEDFGERLHINAANCLHCKACDIKDPTQNIIWSPAEGGSGPNYQNM